MFLQFGEFYHSIVVSVLINIPNLYCFINAASGKKVFDRSMPTHIQAFPGVRRELYIRLDQVFLAALIIIEDPKLDLAIFGGRSEQPVLKWRPLKIKNAARVAFNKRKSRVELLWLHRIKDCD